MDYYKFFKDNGCNLAKNMDANYFTALCVAANMKICEGCWTEGRCGCEKKVRNLATKGAPSNKLKEAVKTNAQWAVQLGVTKRQVAKLRKEGGEDALHRKQKV